MTRSDSLAPTLPAIFDKQLFAYATAACAAGVGLLAMNQPAEAKIVYTPANLTIPVDGGVVQFDLNNDGIPDFGLYNFSFAGVRRLPLGSFAAYMDVLPANAANEVWAVQSKGGECAAALPPKVKVGPNSPFQPGNLPMWSAAGNYTNPGTVRCPWQDKHRGAFLGLKFVVNGEAHYGWAHVGFDISTNSTVLNGYAYETVPNQPIYTGKTSGPVVVAELDVTPLPVPQPATLGMLAQGSRGLEAWRRPEEQEAA